MTSFNEFRHLTVKEGQQQCADMSTINISIGHENNTVIAQLFWLVFLLADTGTECCNQRCNLLRSNQLVETSLFNVEDLPLERQNGLKFTISPLFRRATGGIALDQIELTHRRVFFLAIRKFSWKADPVK